jgi:hypothetical protein
MKKRLIISVILGATLGIFCIIGIGFRLGYAGNELFLFSAWYNRVVIGLLIGLATPLILIRGKWNPVVRGALLGLIVSYSWYVASGNRDTMGFLAGIAYGVIIDWVATKFTND